MKKTVLITGGSSGLGKEIAAQLQADYNVVILCLDAEKVQTTAQEIGCTYAVADVTNVEQLQAAVDSILTAHGQIDVLINCAGIWTEGQLDETDPERIKQIMDVNLTGVMYSTRAVLPSMRKQKGGMIINIVSQAGINKKPNRSVYYASKWGLRGFTECLQKDLQPEGIRVTGIYPGFMSTPLFETAGHGREMDKALDPVEVAKSIKFIMELDEGTHIPAIGLRSINEV